jgi:hypothetical protein
VSPGEQQLFKSYTWHTSQVLRLWFVTTLPITSSPDQAVA